MKIRPVGAELFRADTHRQTDRQTDRYDEANSSFSRRHLAKALTNKKRVNVIFIVKLEKIVSGIFRFLSEIFLWRRLQVKLSILKKWL
jgi:hypothetical protein